MSLLGGMKSWRNIKYC